MLRTARVVVVVLLTLASCLGPGSARMRARQHDGESASTRRPSTPPALTGASRARALEALDAMPLHFEVNVGQADPGVRFLARGAGYGVALTPRGAVLSLTARRSPASAGFDAANVGLMLVAASPNAHLVGVDPLAGRANYYRGNDPAKWHTDVHTFSRVQYQQVYPGIDLVYYGHQGELQYDFHVAPGHDPSDIRFEVEGADTVNLDAEGNLQIGIAGRTVRQRRPFTYQEEGGTRREVPSRFVLDGTVVRFEVGAYDASRELVIDPVLTYSTWFGGRSDETITDIAVDASGNILVTGASEAAEGYPTTPGALRTSRGGNNSPTDAFVAKFSPSGSTLLFSTLLGGDGDDGVVSSRPVGGVAAQPNGNVVIVGATKSANFPTTANADDPTFNETGIPIDPDAFVTVLSPTGTLVSSTYLGGSDIDFAVRVDVDGAGRIYVAGLTRSDIAEGFPITATTYDGTLGGSDAFLVRYSAAGVREYATYIGGSGTEYANPNVDVKVDTNQVVFVGGETSSIDFPTKNGYQSAQGGGGGSGDGWIVRIDTSVNGSAGLLWGTLFGGNVDESFSGIARDASGKVYATGFTRSLNIPAVTVPGGPAPVDANFDALVVKFDPSQSGAASLVYALRLSGSGHDEGTDVTVDSHGRAWIVGNTNSTDFVLKNAFDSQPFITGRPFVAEVNEAGTDLLMSSRAGGRNTNGTTLTSVTVTSLDEILMAGEAGQPAPNSDSLELVNPYQSVFGGGAPGTNDGGGRDGVIQKLGPAGDLSLTKAAAPAPPATVLPGQTVTYTITVTNNGPDPAANVTVTDTLPATLTVDSCTASATGVCGGSGSARTASFPSLANGASATVTFVTTVTGAAGPGTSIANTATVSAHTADVNPANNTASATLLVPALTDPSGDADNDGLPNGWEQRFGLNPLSSTGDNGPGADPDGDGKTNLQEYQEGTHPRGFVITYLAEGATAPFFSTRVAIANPTATPALVLTRFQRKDGRTVPKYQVVPPMTRATIDVGTDVDTVADLASAEFSTLVEADVQVVVDRTMKWPLTGPAAGYGSHAERGILTRTATTWYLAEGATFGDFDLFYLIQNPGTTAAAIEVTYLLPSGAPVVKTYQVPGQSRFNIWVDQEGAELANAELSAIVRSTNGVPVIVERAMYQSRPGQTFAAGHESAGVTAPATSWFLAEGATGSYFDLFILVANPNAQAAELEARYLLPDGTVIVKPHRVEATSRFNIWVDLEDARLADAAVSTTVTSTNGVPIIVERAMWWPGTSEQWQEAHNSPGSTETGVKWAMAEGELGGPSAAETYILVANTSATAGTARVTLVFEDGTAPVAKDFALPANSRTNVAVAAEFAAAAGKRFGAIVESVGASPAQIVVERAIYEDAGGVRWAAGSNALATRLQ